MVAIFKSSLQNLSPLATSLKVKPVFKPKTDLNFFVNIAKTKTTVLVAIFLRKLRQKSQLFIFAEVSKSQH